MANENIEKLIRYCKTNHIEKIGIAYCYCLEPEARFLIGELESQGAVIASACSECDSMDTAPNDFEASRIARYFNVHETGVNLIIGLCPLQLGRFLKEIRSISTTVNIKPA
jgi:uncharacterized metal-binding protein